MRRIYPISCTREFIDRLNKMIPAQRRSGFIVAAVKKALDEKEQLDIQEAYHKKVFEEKVVPAVQSCWPKDPRHISDLLGDTPAYRDGIRERVSKKLGWDIADDELLKAIYSVAKEA
jgi:hypothetical protein